MNNIDLIDKIVALGKTLDERTVSNTNRYVILPPVVMKRLYLGYLEWNSPYWVVAGEKFRSRRLARTWVKQNIGYVYIDVVCYHPSPIEYVEIKGEVL